MSDTANELAAYLEWARTVNRVLPVDHEADRGAAAALRRYHESLPPPRKLKRKS